MTLYSTAWSISSDITPERAFRVSPGRANTWQLSWLGRRTLTREQAVAGMELDELLSDPGRVFDQLQISEVDERARLLGILSEQAIILLARRVAERIRITEEIENRADYIDA